MRSLFIGRFQPFHEGHKALMETRLKEGKKIVIALRDTPIDESNPYTVQERMAFIHEAMRDWRDQYDVIVIPDIDEVCYGREVGYRVTEIRLDQDTEAVSATKIRQVR